MFLSERISLLVKYYRPNQSKHLKFCGSGLWVRSIYHVIYNDNVQIQLENHIFRRCTFLCFDFFLRNFAQTQKQMQRRRCWGYGRFNKQTIYISANTYGRSLEMPTRHVESATNIWLIVLGHCGYHNRRRLGANVPVIACVATDKVWPQTDRTKSQHQKCMGIYIHIY